MKMDLYLAFGCAQGSSSALELFRRDYQRELERAVRRVGSSLTLDEAMHLVLERLVVATPPRRPRMASYNGRTSLATWFRVVASNALIDLSRSEERHHSLDTMIWDDVCERRTPEMELLHARYEGDMRAALKDAFASLSAAERNLLRYAMRGLGVRGIGRLTRRHPATVARQLSSIRLLVLNEFSCNLIERLRMSPTEAASLIRFFRSRLELLVPTSLNVSTQ